MVTRVDGNTGVSAVQDGVVAASDLVQTVASGVAKPMQIMQLAAKATTVGTSIDFSPADGTGIPSWAKEVSLIWADVSTNGASPVQVQLGTSAGMETTGYSGYEFRATNSGTGSSSIATGFPAIGVGNAAYSRTGRLTFSLLSGNTWVIDGGSTYDPSGPSGFFVAGKKALSAVLDRIRITTVNGTDTFDAGSVSIIVKG